MSGRYSLDSPGVEPFLVLPRREIIHGVNNVNVLTGCTILDAKLPTDVPSLSAKPKHFGGEYEPFVFSFCVGCFLLFDLLWAQAQLRINPAALMNDPFNGLRLKEEVEPVRNLGLLTLLGKDRRAQVFVY